MASLKRCVKVSNFRSDTEGDQHGTHQGGLCRRRLGTSPQHGREGKSTFAYDMRRRRRRRRSVKLACSLMSSLPRDSCPRRHALSQGLFEHVTKTPHVVQESAALAVCRTLQALSDKVRRRTQSGLLGDGGRADRERSGQWVPRSAKARCTCSSRSEVHRFARPDLGSFIDERRSAEY